MKKIEELVNKKEGFMLLDLVIALAIISIVLMASFFFIDNVIKMNHRSEVITTLNSEAKGQIEDIRTYHSREEFIRHYRVEGYAVRERNGSTTLTRTDGKYTYEIIADESRVTVKVSANKGGLHNELYMWKRWE